MTNIPSEMTAIEISKPGDPEVLLPTIRKVPTPTGSQVLIKVHAAGVNRPDVAQRRGTYPPPAGASDLPGLEVSGTIVAIGDEVSLHKIGDNVLALTPGGGYAEYCVTHEGHALPIPSNLSMTEAAAIAETFFTVWTNVFQIAGLQPEERFLVHGGTSGIGTTAIQMARALGSEVFATAGSDKKCDACRDLGATHTINYKEKDFSEVIKEATDGKGVDVILDMIGGDYVKKNWQAAAMDGRIVQIASLNGAADDLNFGLLMMKRLLHTGSTLRPRSDEFKTGIAGALKKIVWPLVEDGMIRPVIDSTYPLNQASKAHAHMETNNHIGKIVLVV